MILLCAATGAESRACRQGISAARAAGFEVLRTGVGLSRATDALSARLRDGPKPSLVVSSGFAGSLTDHFAPLTWVTASSVHRFASDQMTDVQLPPELLRVFSEVVACPVVSRDDVAAPDAVRLFLAGPGMVDMESAALAEVAAGAAIPFAVLRLITDAPGCPLPRLAHSAACALSSRSLRGRAGATMSLCVEALTNPLSAIRFARTGLEWCAELEDGWKRFAPELVDAKRHGP